MSRVLDLWAGMTGTVLPFAGSAAPTDWLLCYGQAVSRATYANLFAVIGTTYGAGDGSTTFNVPDLRGRVAAGKDNMGGTAANRLQVSTTITTTAGSATATVASAAGLTEGMTVIASTIPAGVTITFISGTTITLSSGTGVTAGSGTAARFSLLGDPQTIGQSGGSNTHSLSVNQMPAHTHSVNNAASTTVGGAYTTASLNTANGLQPVTTSTGGGVAHPNVQPTIVLNSIIKT